MARQLAKAAALEYGRLNHIRCPMCNTVVGDSITFVMPCSHMMCERCAREDECPQCGKRIEKRVVFVRKEEEEEEARPQEEGANAV